jgi:hypothetical protein
VGDYVVRTGSYIPPSNDFGNSNAFTWSHSHSVHHLFHLFAFSLVRVWIVPHLLIPPRT